MSELSSIQALLDPLLARPILLPLVQCRGELVLDARAVHVADSFHQLGKLFPTTSLEHASDETTAALLDRWASLAGREPARVALLPVSANAEPAAIRAYDELARVGSVASLKITAADSSAPSLQEAKIVLGLGGIPGSDSAGEGVAIHSDVSVLVVTKGTRIADLQKTLGVLEQYGVAPVWAVMAPATPARESTDAPTRPRAVASTHPNAETSTRPGRQPSRRVRRTLGVDGSKKVVPLADADSAGHSSSSRSEPDDAGRSGVRTRSARSSSVD